MAPLPSSSSSSSSPVSTVTALLEASRLADRRQAHHRSTPFGRDEDGHLRQLIGTSNAGFQFALSDSLQSEIFSKKRTAGPAAPQSWWREAQAQAAARKRSGNDKNPKPAGITALIESRRAAYQPNSLREECICLILKDLAGAGDLLEEVPYLPMHVKEAMLYLAPRVAPLSDAGVEALLLDPEHLQEDSQVQLEDQVQREDWEQEITNGLGDVGHEGKQIVDFDLSHSSVSIRTLRKVFLLDPDAAPRKSAPPRLTRLRSLSLSHATNVALNPALITLLSSLPGLTSISLAGLASTLHSPLYSLSIALPFLQELNLSHSPWLRWSDIARIPWATVWMSLNKLEIVDCEQLCPNASYMDPEARGGGPGTVMQAMSMLREQGRQRWVEICA